MLGNRAEFNNLPEVLKFHFPRISRQQLEGLERDIDAVAFGLRCACLLDIALLSPEEVARVAHDLQLLPCPWGKLKTLYERFSSQTFFVNDTEIRAKLKSEAKDSLFPVYIEASGKIPVLLDRHPKALERLFGDLRLLLASVSPLWEIVLKGDTSTSDLVGFTGFMLDYPIIYTLKESGHNCLGDCELQLCKIKFKSGASTLHPLLSFSYPTKLYGLPSVEEISSHLLKTFQGRLGKAHQNKELPAFLRKAVNLDVETIGPLRMERFSL